MLGDVLVSDGNNGYRPFAADELLALSGMGGHDGSSDKSSSTADATHAQGSQGHSAASSRRGCDGDACSLPLLHDNPSAYPSSSRSPAR